MGMAMICRAAAVRGLCSAETAATVEDLLTAYGLPIESPYGLEALSAAVLSDKKIMGGSLALIVPRAVGQCGLHTVPATELRDWLRDGGAL